jgi:RNA polymerase sigma-70 factor (ECF subfamily)
MCAAQAMAAEQATNSGLNPDPGCELMLAVQTGSVEAFECLVARYRGPLVRYLYRIVLDQASAEDLAQEVFIRIYRHRHDYRAAAKFTSWMYRIASNAALNWIRDHRRERDHESIEAKQAELTSFAVRDPRPNADTTMTLAGIRKEIQQAVRELPDRQRMAVMLHKFEDMNYREIASALNCSEGALKSILFRAYTTLRTRLAAFEGASLSNVS